VRHAKVDTPQLEPVIGHVDGRVILQTLLVGVEDRAGPEHRNAFHAGAMLVLRIRRQHRRQLFLADMQRVLRPHEDVADQLVGRVVPEPLDDRTHTLQRRERHERHAATVDRARLAFDVDILGGLLVPPDQVQVRSLELLPALLVRFEL
jgi:hypothetical protein